MNSPCRLVVVFSIIVVATNISYTTAFYHGTNTPLLRRYLKPQQHQSSWITASPRNRCQNGLNNWVGDLWSEIIEFSTYGPEERRMLAERRKAAAAKENGESGEENFSVSAFSKAKKRVEEGEEKNEEFDLSPEAFQAAVDAKSSPAAIASSEETTAMNEFDGYALRDLLVTKWGAQLDIDFQRNTLLSCVYCNILPVSFGNKLCRHESELAYLMHLQGIIEILRKYDNLELFLDFIETTNKVPKRGTDSVPFRLVLTEEQLQKIM